MSLNTMVTLLCILRLTHRHKLIYPFPLEALASFMNYSLINKLIRKICLQNVMSESTNRSLLNYFFFVLKTKRLIYSSDRQNRREGCQRDNVPACVCLWKRWILRMCVREWEDVCLCVCVRIKGDRVKESENDEGR